MSKSRIEIWRWRVLRILSSIPDGERLIQTEIADRARTRNNGIYIGRAIVNLLDQDETGVSLVVGVAGEYELNPEHPYTQGLKALSPGAWELLLSRRFQKLPVEEQAKLFLKVASPWLLEEGARCVDEAGEYLRRLAKQRSTSIKQKK